MFWWEHDAGHGVRVAFTDRGAGNLSAATGEDPEIVGARRGALEQAMGVPERSLVFLRQVHGTDVLDADRPGRPPADAAVTAAGVPLAVLVADCVPVVLVGEGPAGPVTGVAHAGRRGLLDGVLERTVEQLRARGAHGLTAWIGPSVCGNCYEVPVAMQAESVRRIPAVAATTSWGTPALDLRAGARDRLAARGVEVAEAAGTAGSSCTLENTGLFSHRRDPRSGRTAGVVWRADTAGPAGAAA